MMSRSALKVLLIVVVFALSGLSEGCAMGAFDSLVLFSQVRGTVLKDGKPVQGAEVIEKVEWPGNEVPPQRAVTDEKGVFSFPAIERNAGLRRLIPSQPMVHQTIVIHYQGVEYEAWMHGKDNYEPNTELDGRPLNFVCELTHQPEIEGTHYGICKPV